MSEPMLTAIVAPNRTVQTGNPSLITYVTGYKHHAPTWGVSTAGDPFRIYQPGEEITLPVAEAQRLLKNGVLVPFKTPAPAASVVEAA